LFFHFWFSEAISVDKVLRIGSLDYEPSEIVQQVHFDTKVAQGANLQAETKPEERKNLKNCISRWKSDSANVD